MSIIKIANGRKIKTHCLKRLVCFNFSHLWTCVLESNTKLQGIANRFWRFPKSRESDRIVDSVVLWRHVRSRMNASRLRHTGKTMLSPDCTLCTDLLPNQHCQKMYSASFTTLWLAVFVDIFSDIWSLVRRYLTLACFDGWRSRWRVFVSWRCEHAAATSFATASHCLYTFHVYVWAAIIQLAVTVARSHVFHLNRIKSLIKVIKNSQ